MLSRSFWIVIVLALLLSAPHTLGAAPLSLIDIIPNSFSGETDQNSEPNIAVNPSNVSQMIISVFANTDISPYFSTQTPSLAGSRGEGSPSSPGTRGARRA
jgi:hypothetical protein